MLLAETDYAVLWAAIGGVVTALLTGAGVLLGKYFEGKKSLTVVSTAAQKEQREARETARRMRRADSLSEWKAIAEKLQEDADTLMKEVRDTKAEHSKEIRQLQADHGKCLVENAKRDGEIRLLEATVRRLQGLTGDEAPSVITPAVIIADLDGTIFDASPAIAPILHWLPKELRGKNVELLVPERLRQQHQLGLSKAKAGGPLPWTEKAILTHAREKNGGEVPVAINLYGWQDRTGNWLVSAEIKLRQATT